MTETKPSQDNQHDIDALRTSQERFSSFLKHTGDGILLTDEQGIITDWNPALERISGVKAQDSIGKPIWDCQPLFIHSDKRTPENIARITSDLKKFFLSGESHYCQMLQEKEFTTPEGKWGAIQSRSFQIHTTKGFILGAIIRDVSEQKIIGNRIKSFNQELEQRIVDRTAQLQTATQELEAQITGRLEMAESLRQSEDHLQWINENMLDGICHIDSSGIIRYASPSIKNILGIGPGELVGKDLSKNVHPDDLEKNLNILRAAIIAHQPSLSLEYRYSRQDGSNIWMESNCRMLYSGDDIFQGAILGTRNITERKLTEEALRRSEERFRKYFELPLIGVAITAPNMCWIALNDKLCNTLGYSRKELEKNSWADLTPHEDLLPELELYQQVLVGKIEGYTLEKRFICKDGSLIYVEVSNQCVRKNNGGVDYFVELVQDITQRKEHDTELEAVAAVSSALRSAQSRREMGAIILEQISKVLKTDGAALLVSDPLANELVVELGMGNWAYLTDVRQPAGEGFYASLLSSGKAYTSNNLSSDHNFINTGRVEQVLAGICIPLSAENQPVGAFWVGRVKPLSPHEERLLSAIANIAANALRRATLHEQTEQRLQRLNILHQIDAAISTSHDLKTKLAILLSHVSSQLGVDAADVLTYNHLSREFQYAGGLGFRTHFIESAHVRSGEGFAGRAGKDRQRISVRDLSKEKDDFSRALMLSGEDFVTYHCMPLITRGDIKGVLEVFSRNSFNASSEWLEFLDVVAGQIAIAIDSTQLFENLQYSNAELMRAYDATIEGWSRALELRDLETQGHSQRVTEMTLDLAQKMGIEAKEQLTQVRRGALLHDIGKMGMPDGILLKQGPLEPEEWRVMRQHPVYAYSMLSPIEFLRPALEIPYCHHERWDGSGYPRGLKGEEIPLEARVFTIVDVWDALTSNRPYRPAWSEEKTLDYLQDQKGKLFDPAVLEKFLESVC